MRFAFLTVHALALLALGGFGAALAQGAPDQVLAETATVKLTRGDYEADIQALPPDMRGAFATDPRRITKLLNNMLVGKTLAEEARKAGADQDPMVQRRIAIETDKVLAQVQIQRIERAAGAEFDSRTDQFLLKARERYTVDKDKYRTPEEVSVSHILFSIRTRTPEAALALAQEAQAKLRAGADFASLARELSDDTVTKGAGGHLDWFASTQYEPAFAKAAFELKNVGDVSEPVLSHIGYHLIRLDGRRAPRAQSFDEVKGQIMADLRQAYVGEQRDARIAAIQTDPTLKVNQPAIDSLVVPVDSSMFKRALSGSK